MGNAIPISWERRLRFHGNGDSSRKELQPATAISSGTTTATCDCDTLCLQDEEEVEYQEEATVGDEEVSRVQGTEDHTVHTTPNDKQSKGNLNDKPLYEEVTLIGSGTSKNAGGTKVWVCKHCKEQFVSSYTRMHNHFFGPPIGKKGDIKRCRSVLKDPTNYRKREKTKS
ncbi:hypothetical protein LXL04_014324 [Taraxacum kok-saghyz]